MARHPKSVNISLQARSEFRARIDGPACEKCGNLQTTPNAATRRHGRLLDAENCPDFKDASRHRDYYPNFDYNGRFRR